MGYVTYVIVSLFNLEVGRNIYWELNFQFWAAIVFIYKICQSPPPPFQNQILIIIHKMLGLVRFNLL